MNLDKVTIVLPTHNGSMYLRDSIESCLRQTYRNIELIIVDDASTDETPKIVSSISDERIRYVRHDENQGLPSSLNTGFALASGEYLTWTSDDNMFSDCAIERMLSFLKRGSYAFVYCDYYRFDQDTSSKRILVKLPDRPQFDEGNQIGACFLYTRLVMEVVGTYDCDADLAEDFDYWIRVSKRFQLNHFPESLYYYRNHGASLSAVNRDTYGVRISTVLVMLKNKVLGPREAAIRCSQTISEPIWVSRHRMTGNRCLRLLLRFAARLQRNKFSRDFTEILMLYSEGRLTLQQARFALITLVVKGLNFGICPAKGPPPTDL